MSEGISYVVGEEKRIRDLLARRDLDRIFGAVSKGWSCEAALLDGDGAVIHSSGEERASGKPTIVSLPVHLEGEEAGTLRLRGGEGTEELRSVAALLRESLEVVIHNSLKRMLTTEMHTTVVSLSYEELVEANRRLTESEGSLRALSESLERQVEERTAELRKAHVTLLGMERMAAIGQLAAGVAHEINNPMGFVTSNMRTLGKYLVRLVSMVRFYRGELMAGNSSASIAAAGEELWKMNHLDAVIEDGGPLLDQSLEGAERVGRIVADLKEFSHVDDSGEIEADLNEEIDRTLNVLASRFPADSRVEKEYGKLPLIRCYPNLFCQAFLNLMQNAIQARGDGLVLRIATSWDGREINLTFADNGPGVPPEARTRIFDPFYSTKPVGEGTGMGLPLVFDVAARHGGTVVLESPPEGGALFRMRIPKVE